jgi:hypothetical protein
MTNNAERDAFENWFYSTWTCSVTGNIGAAAWGAWQARAQASGVPDGWKLVPIDLTVNMLDAGKQAHYCAEEACRTELMEEYLPEADRESMRWRSNRVVSIFDAILAAAPAPPKSASVPVERLEALLNVLRERPATPGVIYDQIAELIAEYKV